MPNNRKSGNAFEKELCQILADHGFWVHNMAQTAAGQPFDVIAVKNGTAYAIDAKVCEKNHFPLSRIESNQESAMLKWRSCGNGNGWFALKISTGIYMIPYCSMWVKKDCGTSYLIREDIEYYNTLETWIKGVEVFE